MSYDPERQHRRSIRLPGYDYSQAGAYFITTVTQGRACLFGEIVDGKMIWNDAGRTVEKYWNDIPAHFPDVELDEFVVMPNHVHGILSIMETVGTVGAKNFSPLLPPLPEQATIVRFLDHVDRRIRRYIRARQKLIKLLEEQKQAIIHRAVTRGLDPNVRLKPSGAEWLGDVPEHWEVVPLRWYISIGSGDFIETERVCNEATQDRPYPVIGGNGVMGYAATFNSHDTTIVIGRVGELCGNVHLVSMQAWITDNALRVSRIKGFAPDYLTTQMRAMNLNRLANANAQPLVTGGMIKAQRVVKPSIEEQQTLVTHLRDILEPIEVAIAKARREISLLQEYHTRLIADVVTGKLDMREAAARLPEEDPLRDFASSRENDPSDELSDAEEETEVVEELEE